MNWITALLLLASTTLAQAQQLDGRDWVSAQHRNHPLVGKLVTGEGKPTTVDELWKEYSYGSRLLLGESHDNLDHHLLQAEFLREALTRRKEGERFAVIFEMLPFLWESVTKDIAPLDTFGERIGWEKRGWGDFDAYRPIFEAGLEGGVTFMGAEMDSERREIEANTHSEDLERFLGPLRNRALIEDQRQAMIDSHCGLIDDDVAMRMVRIQRIKDNVMGSRVGAPYLRHSVLIAGREHVRDDVGVGDTADTKNVSVAFIEVQPDKLKPTDYELFSVPFADGTPGISLYDFIIFTPSPERTGGDPCEGMAEAFGKAKTNADE